MGRALGYLGIGIDVSIASANEVQTAVQNQDTKDAKSWLTEAQFNATMKGTADQAKKVLASFKMKKEYRQQINQKFNI